MLGLSMNRSEKGPYPCCQENPRDCEKFSWIHFDEPDFNNGTALATGTVLGKESSK
ncbi:MAG: hypothetical protein QOE55_7163 [Acidobacteriaceae bacterium]|jgi:hypothetical protein|nr:hypothetical protein [Acidobacteriaceae bacterium]